LRLVLRKRLRPAEVAEHSLVSTDKKKLLHCLAVQIKNGAKTIDRTAIQCISLARKLQNRNAGEKNEH
jgi:hypothetical protein